MAISPINTSNLSSNSNTGNSVSSQVKDEDVTDIDSQIKKGIRQSVDFQIITKTLAAKVNMDEQSPGKQKHLDALSRDVDLANDEINNIDVVNISQQALSFSQQNVTVENRSNSSQSSTSASAVSIEQGSLSISSGEQEVQQSDPLALDLDGNGLTTSGVENGILFDIDGDGTKEKTSFISGGDAFLAYDKNGNGVIDNGKELFGDSNGYQHGFAELAAYDDNKDGKIDAADAIYDKLQLLSIDQEGKQKLENLNQSKVASINLDYTEPHQAINQYDSIAQLGEFTYKDGTKGQAGDLLLGHKKI